MGVGALRWRGALGRLVRPRFWVGVAVLAGATAVAFQVGTGGVEAAGEGMRIAARMTLRAMLVTAVFAALAVELANPQLHKLLARVGGSHWVTAGEIAFATLPRVIAAMPPARAVLRHPAQAVGGLVRHVNTWLAEGDGGRTRPVVVILTGEVGAGKTTFAARLVALLKARSVRVGGILAPGSWRDGQRWGFELQAAEGTPRLPLICRQSQPGWVPRGGFFVNPAAFQEGARWLGRAVGDRTAAVVVDEVGPWELGGAGWAEALDELVAKPPGLLILVVRRHCLPAVVQRWGLEGAQTLEVSQTDPRAVADDLVRALAATGENARRCHLPAVP